MTHSAHFNDSCNVLDIQLRTTQMREEIRSVTSWTNLTDKQQGIFYKHQGMNEGKVLINTFNMFYLWLYRVRHEKDHSDSERENVMLSYGLLFPVSSKFFYMHHQTG